MFTHTYTGRILGAISFPLYKSNGIRIELLAAHCVTNAAGIATIVHKLIFVPPITINWRIV